MRPRSTTGSSSAKRGGRIVHKVSILYLVLATLAFLVCLNSLVGITRSQAHHRPDKDRLLRTKHAFQGGGKASAIVQRKLSSNLVEQEHKSRAAIVHITVTVSNLTTSKDWYARALPVVPIDRNIQTSVRGAWFRFTCCFDAQQHNKSITTTTTTNKTAACCCPTPSLCDTQLHLLEKKPETTTTRLGADITGQHIGLDLGDVGDIREILFAHNIPTTLAPDTVKDSGLTQALFVTDPDSMTWEFTHQVDDSSPSTLLRSLTTLPANRTGMPLHRPSRDRTATDTTLPCEKPFKFAISSGNPLATAAGYAALQIGGSAADAAIAAAAVLSVVEPFNGGIGGDFVAVVHDPRAVNRTSVLNGSGRVPRNSKSLSDLLEMLQAKDGREIPKRGGLSALSVPGMAAAWCRLHAVYGRLPWELVLQPAVMLASEGFLGSNRTAQVWEEGAHDVIYGLGERRLSKDSKEEFLEMFAPGYRLRVDSKHLQRMTPRAGERFYNPALAATLDKLARHGCEWFYSQVAK
jgi:hypothetical protein